MYWLAMILALQAVAHAADPAACPEAICDAAFDNALGGPVDCCDYDYAANDNKCIWGGTPVSFTATGYCLDPANKTTLSLIPSNFQGPPTDASDACRCQVPLGDCKLMSANLTVLAETFGTCSLCFKACKHIKCSYMEWGEEGGCPAFKFPEEVCCRA